MNDNAVMFAFVCSVVTGVAVFYVVWLLYAITDKSDNVRSKSNVMRDDEDFIRELRQKSRFFYYGESLIREFAEKFKDLPYCNVVRHELFLLGDARQWAPSLWIGTQVAQVVAAGFLAFPVCCFFLNPILSFALSVALGATAFILAVFSLKSDAKKAKERIKLRLPFAVDLMALTLNAGAHIEESLRIVAEENAKHPLGKIFLLTLQDYTRGKSFQKALGAMSERMQDQDFSEITFAVDKATELGAELAPTLLELARQMRLKRQQRGEKVASEAEVNILYPGFVVMIACMLILVAPFILMALSEGELL